MAKSKKVVNAKTKELMSIAFGDNVNTAKDFHAREEIIDYINNELRAKEENKRLCFKLSVDDPDKKHWQKNEHFVKIFYHEFEHAEEYYSLTDGEKLFIFKLGKFLKWEMNILVDENDYPLNQTSLAERINMDVRSIRRNMKSLEKKKIIVKIETLNEVFYIVNPYLIFVGQNINSCVPGLFDDIEYHNSRFDDKNGRSNRRKEQEKRIEIREN